MSNYKKACELGGKISTYTAEMSDSLQEACDEMVMLVSSVDYLSDDFYTALIAEMESKLADFESCCKWVEYEEEVPATTRKVRELVCE